MDVRSQIHTTDALPQRKELKVPVEKEAGWSPVPVRTCQSREDFLVRMVIELRTHQPTDWTLNWLRNYGWLGTMCRAMGRGGGGVTLSESAGLFRRYCAVCRVELHSSGRPDDRFGPSGEFLGNFTQLTCLEITGYRNKYSTVLWLLELQIRRGRKV